MEHILFGFCRVINSENDKWTSVGISTCILVGHCSPRRLCLRSFDFCIKYHQCHMMANAIRTEERKANMTWRMSTVYLMSFWYSLLRNVETHVDFLFNLHVVSLLVAFEFDLSRTIISVCLNEESAIFFWILLVIAMDCSVPLQQNSIRYLVFGERNFYFLVKNGNECLQ